MSQHDYVIDNASGATVRADINSALAAIQSLNSGSSAPSSTVAGMLWLDTTGGVPYALKVRDAGNNHWLTIGNVTDPGADANLELLPGKINLPSSGGVFESDGSTEILTESSGAVTLKNTTIDGTVSMASSGLTVRNIENVLTMSSDVNITDITETTFFSPTYTNKISGSKVQGILTFAGRLERSGGADGRGKLVMFFSGSNITNFNTLNQHNIGAYDFGNGGIQVNYYFSIMGPLMTTTSIAQITCDIKATLLNSDAEYLIMADGTTSETFFTWIEYK